MDMRKVHEDERGIAMVIAILVSMVVLIIAIGVYSLSMHNLDASANASNRLLAVNGAEAGIDYTWWTLQRTASAGSLPCSLTGTTTTAPTSTYAATIQYY